MSWAEDQHWFGLEDWILSSQDLRKERLLEAMEGYYHYDINGNKIDVREVDARYAKNIYNFYLRKFDGKDREDVVKTLLMTTLKRKVAGE